MKKLFFLFCAATAIFAFTTCGVANLTTKNTTANGQEYVDMGLSVKWATCNLGADSPEKFGNYFAWGEIYNKHTYSIQSSNTYGDSTISDIAGVTRYDAARARLGDDWRMPTVEEMEELLTNTDMKWTKRKRVEGLLLTSKKNGNSIFLPCTGVQHSEGLIFQDMWGDYWSSTPDTEDSRKAFMITISKEGVQLHSSYREFGCTIRPVRE